MGQAGRAGLVIVLLALAATLGCRPRPVVNEEKGSAKSGASQATGGKGAPTSGQAAKASKRVEEPPPDVIPQVKLSAENLATCLVKVGDTMPDAELADVAGKKQSLRSMLGKKLTVVFFWSVTNDYSIREVDDMQSDIFKPYADKGVQVIGIDEGDAAEKIQPVLNELQVKFPVLLDPQKEYFKKVAKEKLLRTYLLDGQGKILWFDIEYSSSTRRDLKQGIDVALKKAA